MNRRKLFVLSILLCLGMSSFAAEFNVIINISEINVSRSTNLILQYRVKGEDDSMWHSVNLTPDTQATYTVTGVAAGVEYEFRAILESEYGTGSPSGSVYGVSMDTGAATVIISNVFSPPYIRTLSTATPSEEMELLCLSLEPKRWSFALEPQTFAA